MKAIERIAGYACEVNEEQWRELVKVADEVGLICPYPEWDSAYAFAFIDNENELDAHQTIKDAQNAGLTIIPYPDFLAKLKGEEKWEPKNGEEVEISNDNFTTSVKGLYVGKDDICKNYVIRIFDSYEYVGKTHVRPYVRHIPSITRAEAEQKLKELGVIARIVD